MQNTTTTTIDQINPATGQATIRSITVYTDDAGDVIGEKPSARAVMPGDDLTDLPPEIQAFLGRLWSKNSLQARVKEFADAQALIAAERKKAADTVQAEIDREAALRVEQEAARVKTAADAEAVAKAQHESELAAQAERAAQKEKELQDQLARQKALEGEIAAEATKREAERAAAEDAHATEVAAQIEREQALQATLEAARAKTEALVAAPAQDHPAQETPAP